MCLAHVTVHVPGQIPGPGSSPKEVDGIVMSKYSLERCGYSRLILVLSVIQWFIMCCVWCLVLCKHDARAYIYLASDTDQMDREQYK